MCKRRRMKSLRDEGVVQPNWDGGGELPLLLLLWINHRKCNLSSLILSLRSNCDIFFFLIQPNSSSKFASRSQSPLFPFSNSS